MNGEKIVIFDTTLRDGEQAPGAKMSINEKILIAKNLSNLGVDVIEGGFAAASQAEFEALNAMSKVIENTTICSLSRVIKSDIKLAHDALLPTKNKRLHTFLSTSEIHIKHKLGKTHTEVIEMIKSGVSYGRELFDDVEWSAEDATRTDFDFLCKCVEIAISSGARTINLPDTVGYTTPYEYFQLFSKITKEFEGKNVVFSCHCHDDFGMSVANSISSVIGGARQIECTILGIGERAGNAALEEIIMAIKTRKDILPYLTNIDTTQFVKICELVSNITGFFPPANKAIVGKNAFAHESGIHQDGMLKCPQTYEIMNPCDVGFQKTTLTLGKLSGRNALNSKLIELGFSVTKEELDLVFTKFKKLCDTKKTIYDNDIIALVSDSTENCANEVISYNVISNNENKTITISFIYNGVKIDKTATSTGIFNAGTQCVNQLLDINPVLETYELKAVSLDADAQAISNVVIKFNNKSYHDSGYDTDIIMASVKSYFNACLQVKCDIVI